MIWTPFYAQISFYELTHSLTPHTHTHTKLMDSKMLTVVISKE